MKQYAFIRTTVFGLAVLAVAVSSMFAANGDIPLYQPTTISQPGRYILTRDVSAQGDVFVITADGVTLDLNGHTIMSGTGVGVVLNVAGIVMPNFIRVLNGNIRGGAYGFSVITSPSDLPLEIDSVGIIAPMFDCISVSSPLVLSVRHSTLGGCGGDAIHAEGNGAGLVDVSDSVISDVKGDGIFVSEIGTTTVRETEIRRFGLDGTEAGGVHAVAPGKGGLSVLRSTVGDAGPLASGILVEGALSLPAVMLVGNRVSGVGASGIDLREAVARIAENNIGKNGADGIRLDAVSITTPSDITGNTIVGNALNGVDLRAGTAGLAHNLIGGNIMNGIRVEGVRAFIDGNHLQGNTGAGLLLLNGTGHAYRGNFLRGNTGGAVQDQFGNTDAGGNVN